MSISDIIVVMKLGVVQQTGKPQDIYDDPTNLFVAKFLGTPPINVFEGKVSDGKLYIGGDCVLEVGDLENKDVYVGVRPEGFVPAEEGAPYKTCVDPLKCEISNLEVMGRDVSVVSRHSASHNPVVRSIINSDAEIDKESKTISFSLKPHKVFIFNKETEERIKF